MSFKDQKYLALLIVMSTLVIVFPALRYEGGSRVAIDLLLSFIIVASLLVVSNRRVHRWIAWILAGSTMTVLWSFYLVPGIPSDIIRIIAHLLAAFFFAYIVFIILHHIHASQIISNDSIYGAFCGYLMIGMMFGHLYNVAAIADPEAFRGIGYQYASNDERRYLLIYYSFITLATVGYGDIVPQSGEVRGLAVVEAIIGQFYIAVLVAELINKRHRSGPHIPRSPEQPE